MGRLTGHAPTVAWGLTAVAFLLQSLVHATHYVITSQGRGVAQCTKHAKSVFFRSDTKYTFESPSPTSPVFPSDVAAAPSAAQPAGPVTRSGARVESAWLPSISCFRLRTTKIAH
eukprot:6206489-Pleurochrysis_carterae.AAC.4